MDELINRIAKAPPLQKFGGLALAVILLTVLNFFLLIQPVEDEIAQLDSRQTVLNQQLAEKQEIAQNLTERRREMDVLEQKLAEALTELPEKKEVDELLAQLNDIGKKSGLEIAKVEPGGESPATFFARIPIKMMVTGNYHEIAMFLQEVANMRRIVNVNNIKLSNGVVKNEKVVLSSEFLATTFRFLDKSAAGPETKAAPKKGSK